MKAPKYIATVDIASLGLKAGDPVTGPVVDVLVRNGKAAEATTNDKEETK